MKFRASKQWNQRKHQNLLSSKFTTTIYLIPNFCVQIFCELHRKHWNFHLESFLTARLSTRLDSSKIMKWWIMKTGLNHGNFQPQKAGAIQYMICIRFGNNQWPLQKESMKNKSNHKSFPPSFEKIMTNCNFTAHLYAKGSRLTKTHTAIFIFMSNSTDPFQLSPKNWMEYPRL